MGNYNTLDRILDFELSLTAGKSSDQCSKCEWQGLATHDTCPDCGTFLQTTLNTIPDEDCGDTIVGCVRFDTETGTLI